MLKIFRYFMSSVGVRKVDVGGEDAEEKDTCYWTTALFSHLEMHVLFVIISRIRNDNATIFKQAGYIMVELCLFFSFPIPEDKEGHGVVKWEYDVARQISITMSFRADCRKSILDVLKKEGMPPIIDKTYNSIWDAFAKTQPSVLSSTASSTGQLVDSDIWGNLQRTMEKFGITPAIAKKVIVILKKKYGEAPTQPEIKAMMS
ncbi:hypothetical protein Ocin01_13565 [Orchesella cincta]|uniref:Uncharacterized protein n=1 Tax=Orchesella cincta TaxID=48709 RepID=A0A1D2MJM6_ORCCI|nr:hypothetical protein Ocin01_13565 [Orchesella cincta]